MRADCIRVTHPYVTLGKVLLLLLPFDLHVLSLPLAFILSQDQTLHCNNPMVVSQPPGWFASPRFRRVESPTQFLFVLNPYKFLFKNCGHLFQCPSTKTTLYRVIFAGPLSISIIQRTFCLFVQVYSLRRFPLLPSTTVDR